MAKQVKGKKTTSKKKQLQTPKQSKFRISKISSMLYGISAIFLILTAILLISRGKATYFAVFHKPLHVQLTASTTASQQPIPHFAVEPSIQSSIVTAGDTQTIFINAKSDKSVPAYVEAWIRGPKNKEIYKSPIQKPSIFSANKQYNFSYPFTIPATILTGTYYVSVIIQSTDTNTDYYVNEHFASFIIQ